METGACLVANMSTVVHTHALFPLCVVLSAPPPFRLLSQSCACANTGTHSHTPLGLLLSACFCFQTVSSLCCLPILISLGYLGLSCTHKRTRQAQNCYSVSCHSSLVSSPPLVHIICLSLNNYCVSVHVQYSPPPTVTRACLLRTLNIHVPGCN